MTTDTPLTRYGAANGALASGSVTVQLHHLMGHDLGSWLGFGLSEFPEPAWDSASDCLYGLVPMFLLFVD
ncbi:hypothetical protein C8K44_102407 [Aminobacter sp. AP02]|nr:hypothetical protein C8K44_102407 [Aminobacter sp. AP02]